MSAIPSVVTCELSIRTVAGSLPASQLYLYHRWVAKDPVPTVQE